MSTIAAATTDELQENRFRVEWPTYRKVIDNNCMFHREIYERLRRLLADEAPRPFRFLDLACGDASATAGALRGTAISRYHGIDISEPALELAARALAVLPCRVRLEQRDLVTALTGWHESFDVAWIGQSLHHFRAPEKLELMRAIRRIVGADGLFLIWEPTCLNGEDREDWVDRFEASRPLWSALDAEEWQAMLEHVRDGDFPETASRWRELATEAGFADTKEIYSVPTNLARLYCFRA
jgi:SAM-dependent methyltransferase